MKIIYKLKVLCSRIKDKWCSFKENNFSNTEKSKIWLFNIIGCGILASFFINTGLPRILSYFLFSGLVFLCINLVRIIITLLLKPLFHNSTKSGVYTIMIFLFIYLSIFAGSYVIPMPILLITSFVITAIEILFAKSFWSFFLCKRRSFPVILSLCITVTLNIVLGITLLGEGFQDNYVERYLTLGNQSKNDALPIDKVKLDNGVYSVSQIEYGQNTDSHLAPKTTDLTPYIDNYQGISSMLRGWYWGYDINEVPLAGKIWYPTEDGDYPVLFIIHGNHIMTTKSYLGYDYLGEYLASCGYVVISVDEAFCNAYINLGLSNENDARAILLLENMRLMESYNNDKNCSLYQKMDFNNIALAGHSRGGESVVTAALFNDYKNYPEDGNVTWDYNFNIKSLIAIAPTCDQYQPAQHAVKVRNVNYLLLHGSNDHDVTNFMGYSQYHNITFDKNSNLFKSYVYIAGANHGQFNTKWGRYDLPYPMKPFLNTNNLLDAVEQRILLKTYLKLFLDATLKNDKTSKTFFTDNKEYQKELPGTLYINSYQDSSFDLICDFDEDSNIEFGSTDNVLLEAENISLWKEEKNPIFKASNDYVLHLEWEETKEAVYSIHLSEYNAGDGYLQFDIMDINKKDIIEDKSQLLDAMITLEDSHGNTSSIRMGDYITIYPPLPVKLFKLQFLTGTNDYKSCFQTVRLSCKEFENNNNEFDSSSIVKVDFEFNKNDSGKIMINNIGFGK